MSKSKNKPLTLQFNPEDLAHDKDLLDSISLVTAVFLSAKRRPAVRAAFFATLKSTATMLLAQDDKFPITLKLLDRDAIKEGYGAPVPIKKPVVKKKKKKAPALGK